MNRTLVLAEPGCTHQGDWDTMRRLIQIAAQCGADAYKNQWTSDAEQMCARRHITPEHSTYAHYRQAYGWLQYPVEWHARCAELCKELGIAYACTAFLPQDVAVLAPHVEHLKISSFEQDETLAVLALCCHRKVIVSQGMRDGGDEPPSVDICRREHRRPEMLHCVTAYPAPVDEMNLGVIRKSFGWNHYHGLSDHSRDVDMGAFAVCAGASIVETHFRLYDCDPANPDYPVAFDPGEFTEYIGKIRKAERALGDGVKKIQPSEEWALPYRVTG